MVHYLRIIDPHVHLRGVEYQQYNYLALGFRDAHAVGLCGLGEQPNPRPELTSPEAVAARLKHAQQFARDIYHWIHIGMTNDMENNERALMAVMRGDFRLRSDKTFNTHSTGDMGIMEAKKRREIYELKGMPRPLPKVIPSHLYKNGVQVNGNVYYGGVSCTHCENDRFYKADFDPARPESHSERQDEESEVVSVEETLRNARDTNFQGKVYICHASSPLTIEYVHKERKHLPFRVVLETTWHHQFLNADEDYRIHGNLVKMNPPLRSKKSQERVLDYVLQGLTDVIGTDHAPHPYALKISDKPPSGIPALPFWPKGIELLLQQGIDRVLLDRFIFHNANEIFKLGLPPIEIEKSYAPELWAAYGWNPFSRIDGTTR